MTEFILPKKCAGCPEQARCASEIAGLRVQNEMMKRMGELMMGKTGDELEEVARAAFPEVDEENLQDALAGARSAMGNGLEAASAELEQKEQERRDLVAWCDEGKLTMRAPKGNREFTAAICTSAYLYARSGGGLTHTTAHVRVKPLQTEEQ